LRGGRHGVASLKFFHLFPQQSEKLLFDALLDIDSGDAIVGLSVVVKGILDDLAGGEG
jgi:hypothetical protein